MEAKANRRRTHYRTAFNQCKQDIESSKGVEVVPSFQLKPFRISFRRVSVSRCRTSEERRLDEMAGKLSRSQIACFDPTLTEEMFNQELSMPSPKANILVAFYSRDGSVEALAKAVSEGAREAGAEVRLRRVPDLVSPDVMAKVPGWEERSKRMLAEYAHDADSVSRLRSRNCGFF
jgi:hypothetical protein